MYHPLESSDYVCRKKDKVPATPPDVESKISCSKNI